MAIKRFIPISLFALVALLLVAGSLLASPSFAKEVDEAGEAPSAQAGPPACTNSDCVIYDISTQAQCKLYQKSRTNNHAWHQGLSTYTDNQILGKDIVAYRIRWSNGGWSSWYVTGVNDIDWKFNVRPNTMRRVWSYFYDHTHEYIACG